MGDSSAESRIQQLIHQEYIFYAEEVKPWVDLVEAKSGATPDSLLNEVRNSFGHLVVAAIKTEDQFDLRESNIQDAHAHLRRVVLDCYKIMCIYNQDVIKAFYRKYRFFNLSDVDDGNFLVKLQNLQKEADDEYLKAKRAESTGKNRIRLDEGELGAVYEKYCIAYCAYAEAVEYIDGHYEGVLRVAHNHILGKIIGALGWIISIGLTLYGLIHGA